MQYPTLSATNVFPLEYVKSFPEMLSEKPPLKTKAPLCWTVDLKTKSHGSFILFKSFARALASEVVRVLPALLSIMFLSLRESIVAKLALKAKSPLTIFILEPIASNCPLELLIKSFPKIETIASSDSGTNPGFTEYM